MDFDRVLGALLDGFERDKTRYALIGGCAMGALGAPRATADLDFLLHKDDMPAVHDLLLSLGYKRILHTENVSQYEGAHGPLGCLDFLHAFRKLGLEMLERALEKPLSAGKRRVRVVTPEDLIGLKIQGLSGDPQRRARDSADIEALAQACKNNLDWTRVKEYYVLFGLERDYEALRTRFPDA